MNITAYEYIDMQTACLSEDLKGAHDVASLILPAGNNQLLNEALLPLNRLAALSVRYLLESPATT